MCPSLHSVPTSCQQAFPSFFLSSAQAPSASSNHPSPVTPVCSRLLHCPSPGCAACRAHGPNFLLVYPPLPARSLTPGFPQSVWVPPICCHQTQPSLLPSFTTGTRHTHRRLCGFGIQESFSDEPSKIRSAKQKLKYRSPLAQK